MATDREIIQAESIVVESGCDLLDDDDRMLDVIDGFVAAGSEVVRNVYATIHSTCTLNVSQTVQWGSQRLRPWLSVADMAGAVVRRNLGVFLPAVPQRDVGWSPIGYTVAGFDKLEVLNHPHGQSFALETGEGILNAVRQLIVNAGEIKHQVATNADTKVMGSTKVWPLDEQTFTIHIVNDLLALVGYRGLWVDREGFYRSEPYDSPSTIAPLWLYDAQHDTSVGVLRTETADYFGAPNRWVFFRDDPSGALPIEGNGIHVRVNQSDGPTSVDGRRRVISTVVKLDAVDQASLVVQGDRIVEQDKRIDRRVTITSSANPLHWHFDTVDYADADLGPTARMLVTSWRLPLDGTDMTLELKAV